MKINEVEQALGISKANIRFYEKQNLLAPRRSENGYRDYSDQDVVRLREIIILRKIGISVQDIQRILDGDLPLREAVQANIVQLEEQIEQLNGALELSRQLHREDPEQLDTDRYWQIIQQKESSGLKFVEIMQDYWSSVLKPTVLSWFIYYPTSPKKIWVLFGAFILFRIIWGLVFHTDSHNQMNLLYWPIIFLIVIGITFPLFLLGRKHPKVAGMIASILFWCGALFLALLFLVIIVGLIIGFILN